MPAAGESAKKAAGVSHDVGCGGRVVRAANTAEEPKTPGRAPLLTSTVVSGSVSSSSSNDDDTPVIPDPSCPSSSSPPNNNASSSSKVGDLFQLMRNVTMSFGGGGGRDGAGGAVDGEENLAREPGKPVKYRYRQEAARSRKRTRGRFVSEKAPAFVSITELMALRRAERERQQKAETTPVPVGAG
ncbi:unnamed protein product [Ectocarpus sp. 12 AP-2014]